MHFFNHGLLGLTRMGKQKNHGVYSLRKWSGFFSNPLAIKLPDVFSKTLPSRQAGRAPCFFWMPILGNFFISRKARKAGPLAEREGDVFSQFRASLLRKGFETQRQHRFPVQALRLCIIRAHPCPSVPIRAHPCHPWFNAFCPKSGKTILKRHPIGPCSIWR
jgi:hypothetical protein